MWGDTLVQNVVDGIEDGHVDVPVAVDLLHALRTEVALGNHLHLYLCGFYAVAFSDHRSEGAVTREIAIARYEQVAQVHAVVGIALDGVDGGQETVHLLHGIGHKYGLEIVAIFQSVADARCNGVDILQHAGVLDAEHVGRGLGLDEIAGEDFGKGFGLLTVGTTYGEVGEALQSHFLGMGGTSDAGEVVVGHIEYLMEIFRADEVLVGYDTFDGCNDELIADAGLQFLEVSLEIRRRRDKHQRIVLLYNTVDVVVEVNFVDVEMDAGKIGRVVAEATEVVDAVVATHIPANVVGVTHHNLGYGRCPAAATDDCYLTTIEHSSLTIDH